MGENRSLDWLPEGATALLLENDIAIVSPSGKTIDPRPIIKALQGLIRPRRAGQ